MSFQEPFSAYVISTSQAGGGGGGGESAGHIIAYYNKHLSMSSFGYLYHFEYWRVRKMVESAAISRAMEHSLIFEIFHWEIFGWHFTC